MTRAKEMRDLPLAIDATASGNVGIGGTANEYSNYTTLTINHNTSGGILDIERNGNLVGELYTLSATDFGIQTGQATGAMRFRTNAGEVLTLLHTGKVGIGDSATSPNVPLMVRDSSDGVLFVANTSAAGGQGIGFFTDTGNSRVGIFNNSSPSLDMVFNTGGYASSGEAMRIDNSTKNVGIGTTNPSYKLHSETSSGTDYAGYFRNTSGSGNSTSLIARGGANNTSANFQVQDYSGNGDFTVNGIGQAMIGTTTPYNSRRRLSVHGVSTESAGYQDIVEFLEPNITGGTVSVNFGVANSLNNLAKVDFTYVGAGSTSNRVNLGFHSNDNKLMVYANGLVEVPSYLKSKKGTIQTVVNQPTIYTSANPVNTWAEVNSNFRIDITPRFASGTMILGTYSIPINPTGASNILMAIQPWYSTNGGTTKTMLNQGGPSGSRLSGSHAWFRSSNGYDANDMQNHVVHFGYTHSATTTLTWGFYFRSEGSNTTYFCYSNGNSSLWGWTAPIYMELREVEIA